MEDGDAKGRELRPPPCRPSQSPRNLPNARSVEQIQARRIAPAYMDSVYTLRYNSSVANGIEFDWDAMNSKHLAEHKVTAREFESVMQNSPLDLAYEVVDGEERYRSVGITDAGRLLVAIWTLRDGKVRAVTAFPASAVYKRFFPRRRI